MGVFQDSLPIDINLVDNTSKSVKSFIRSYNSKELESIFSYAEKLVNHSLKERISGYPSLKNQLSKRVKGKFGQYLERYYFGIENNSASEPDFKEVGLELKSNPLRQNKRGSLSAKERVVLNIINYEDIINETWENSHFLSKNELILFVMYLYDEEKNFLDFIIKYVKLWRISGEDREIIRQDWEAIVQKIRDGKAHELSEGDTFYLGACRKGHREGPRKQPYSSIPAKQRAFSFKTNYMNHILKKISRAENVIKEPSKIREMGLDGAILAKLRAYIGLDVREIEVKLGVTLNRKAKNYYAILANRMLGVTADKITEFEKAGIKMKIIRLKHNGVPKESMSFPYFKYNEISWQHWEDSDFYELLERKFLFIIYQMDMDEGQIVFRKAFFWNMPYEDRKEAKKVWLETRKRIRANQYNDLPKQTENRVAHVRPHARNKQDVIGTPDGKAAMKRSFWLNPGYLREQIKKN